MEKKKIGFFVILFVLASLLVNFLVLGITASPTPKDYVLVDLYIDENDNAHVLWLQEYSPCRKPWWHPDKWFNNRDYGGHYEAFDREGNKIKSMPLTTLFRDSIMAVNNKGNICIYSGIYGGKIYTLVASNGSVIAEKEIREVRSIVADHLGNFHIDWSFSSQGHCQINNTGELFYFPHNESQPLKSYPAFKNTPVINVSGKYYFIGKRGTADAENNVYEVGE